MGHQLGLILTPADTANLEQELNELEIATLPSVLPSPGLTVCPTMNIAPEQMGKHRLMVYLAHRAMLNQVKLDPVRNRPEWSIDLIESPVVQFSRCFFDGQVLRMGRLYYTDRFYNAGGECVDKAKEFRSWAQRLFRQVKKSLKFRQDLDGYIGAHAEEWLHEKSGRGITTT